jgi:hypothetical protein
MTKDDYEKALARFMNRSLAERPELGSIYALPCLGEDTSSTSFDAHYLYHVAWAVRKVHEIQPKRHVDIASSTNFCTTISATIETVFIDYRPLEVTLSNLTCQAGDLSNEDDWADNAFDSLSCMHVVEHIGLGRYGDKLDVHGDLKAMDNLMRMLAPGGRLLFVVPVGKPAVHFNAHRVYSAAWINDYFASACELLEFYFIPGPPNLAPVSNCDFAFTEAFPYGCGCFLFRKRTADAPPSF